MANYYGTTLSNDFEVKNSDEVKSVLEQLGMEVYIDSDNKMCFGSEEESFNVDDIVVINKKTGKVLTVMHEYDDYDECLNVQEMIDAGELDEDDLEEISVGEYLQEQLVDGSYIIASEAGSEKLRYVTTCSMLISKDDIKNFDSQVMAELYMNRKEDIKVIIKEFMKENELDNSSWDIDALASALHNGLR